MRVPLRNEEQHLTLQLVAADAVVSAISGVLALLLVLRGYPARGSRGLGVALAAWSYLLAHSGIVVLLRPDPGTLHTLFEGHLTFIERLVRQLAESEHEASADHLGTLLSRSVMVNRSIPETPQRPTG